MGFIKAFAGALGGTLADQWKDFITPMTGAPATAGIIPAVSNGTNAGRGSNTNGSENIISNGSKIVVPEGTALVTMQDGKITGMIAEPGGYTYTNDDQNASSIFSGDGFVSSLIKQSWERFKFGGIPGSQHMAYYVNLKEIPNNKFGTQSEIYWDDAFLNTQAGAMTRGSYTLRITDPILFMQQFVPMDYQVSGKIFDFADMDNGAASQLFDEVVSSLGAAFSIYTNDPSKGNRITKIQGDQLGFAQSLSQAVEDAYQWKSGRGLEIVRVAIQAIEYDEDTKEMLKEVKRADSLSGQRGNSFFQQSVARGIQGAGENGGGAGMAFVGMGMNSVGVNSGDLHQDQGYSNPALSFNQQQAQPQPQAPANTDTNTQNTNNTTEQTSSKEEDPYEKLAKMKKLLDDGIITQEEFDAAKKKLLDL